MREPDRVLPSRGGSQRADVKPAGGATLARNCSESELLAFAEPLCRVARIDRPGLEVLGGDAARAEHGSLTNGNAGSHERLCCDPRLGADRDGFGLQLKMRIVDVVRAAAKVGTLGDDGIFADLH